MNYYLRTGSGTKRIQSIVKAPFKEWHNKGKTNAWQNNRSSSYIYHKHSNYVIGCSTKRKYTAPKYSQIEFIPGKKETFTFGFGVFKQENDL